MADETKHVYKLDDGENHWIVATNEEEALRFGREQYEIPAYADEGVTVAQAPDDEDIPVHFGDETPETLAEGYSLPKGARVDGVNVTAKAQEWAAWTKAGDLIASSVY